MPQNTEGHVKALKKKHTHQWLIDSSLYVAEMCTQRHNRAVNIWHRIIDAVEVQYYCFQPLSNRQLILLGWLQTTAKNGNILSHEKSLSYSTVNTSHISK